MTAPCPTFGFTVAMDGAASCAPGQRSAFRDAWDAFLDGRGLYSTGHWRADGGAELVVLSEASQAADGDRAAVQAWLASRNEIRGCRIGLLDDLCAPEEIRGR